MAKIEDAALREIAFKTEASQDHVELYQLMQLVNAIDPRVILEIGCHNGRSLQCWYDAWRPDLLIGVEIEPTDEFLERCIEMGAVSIVGNSTKESTVQRVRDALEDSQVDFLFIDGSHYYYDVSRDYENYGAMVRPGGIIAFDDAVIRDNQTVEVYRFLNGLDTWNVINSDTGTGMAWIQVD